MNAGGGCGVALTARTTCGWVNIRECSDLLYEKIFPLYLKGSVYKSYVRPAILYGSEGWCLKESEIGIYNDQRSIVKAMCEVQLKDRKMSKDLTLMLGMNETIDQLGIANNVR